MTNEDSTAAPARGAVAAIIRFCLMNRLVVSLVTVGLIGWGIVVAPFDWDIPGLPRDPVPVDAIPDLGDNQQIVFTTWPGRSPEDIDDQITYPLTVALLNVPGVVAVRSTSMIGFSAIYLIFDEDVDFYWSRSRILERLGSLPAGTLPAGVAPALGPDATALGQVFWYTLEGRDESGAPAGGWDLDELRSIQDFLVRYRIAAVDGVAEVASIGGHVREYQVDVDPDAMRAAGVSLDTVVNAVRRSNIDVGARTLEVNRVEYVVRGLGFLKSLEDLEMTAVAAHDGSPILLRDIATVKTGPAVRRGALTKSGVEAVGGVVVVRHGANPMAVIERVKEQIDSIAPGLPSKTLADGTQSRVTVVPFYDRTGLIRETLGTLSRAISQQALITVIVVVLMVLHLRSSVLIGSMLPLAVLMTFIGMKTVGVDANIVALSGIAIAIGTVVDMGIVLSENILRRLDEAPADEPRLDVIHRASAEVGPAVLTSALTTIVGFLPVFTLEAAEGRLFRPLAYTKTFALIAAIALTLTVLPVMAHMLLGMKPWRRAPRAIVGAGLLAGGVIAAYTIQPAGGMAIAVFGMYQLAAAFAGATLMRLIKWSAIALAVFVALIALADSWEPVGPDAGRLGNAFFIFVIAGATLLFFLALRAIFPWALTWALRHKVIALSPAAFIAIFGATVWLGFDRVWGWLPEPVRRNSTVVDIAHATPGLGREFMPSLDEGSFLYMPTTMPHASIGEALDMVARLDLAIMSIPEIQHSVGKIGRVESALDPAPISMIETLIEYKSEYVTDAAGRRLTFRVGADGGFERDDRGELVEDPRGRPYRQWREEIRSPQDIWNEIARAARAPGLTGAPKLQPIETRLVMLQSGFRAPMGIKVFGPDLDVIESFGLELEEILKGVREVEPGAVFADRIVGKPYLEIDIDRERIARFGVSIADVQSVIEVAIGGVPLTTTVEGRERYPVRVRYVRERRDDLQTIGDVLVPTPSGAQIPLRELASIEHRRGPQMIRSEATFPVGYVLFDKRAGVAEVDAVEAARSAIRARIDSGDLIVPAGVSFEFAGSYENQVRAAERLRLVLPLSLGIIVLLLHLQFRSLATSLMIFSGVFVAWGGGFLMLWLYGREGFLDVSLLGVNLNDFFRVAPMNLSVAVWVGFLALFGIAVDDGVVMATRIDQNMQEKKPGTVEEVRAAVIDGARRRVRAATMTTATTILALLPVLTSTGRGADVMIPMAVPIFGGMVVATLTWFVVPVLTSWKAEIAVRGRAKTK